MNEKTIKCVILHLEFPAVKTDLEIKKKRPSRFSLIFILRKLD